MRECGEEDKKHTNNGIVCHRNRRIILLLRIRRIRVARNWRRAHSPNCFRFQQIQIRQVKYVRSYKRLSFDALSKYWADFPSFCRSKFVFMIIPGDFVDVIPVFKLVQKIKKEKIRWNKYSRS